MSYILEVLTEMVPDALPDWVHLCTLDEQHAHLAGAAYAAAKGRYVAVRLSRGDGTVVKDSARGD